MEAVMTVHGLRDPFSFLLQEMAARDAGVRPAWAPGQREQLLSDLLIAEAEEAAHGLQHLSIVHGDPDDPIEAEAVDELLAELRQGLDVAEHQGEIAHVRIGGSESHVTVTVGGPGARASIAWAAGIALQHARPSWHVLETARV
jgi:hypothetical protein